MYMPIVAGGSVELRKAPPSLRCRPQNDIGLKIQIN